MLKLTEQEEFLNFHTHLPRISIKLGETFTKFSHSKYTHTKYVMSVCKKNSDDPTLKYFFGRCVCTYGRKRSSSESDACIQDVDDDSNHHSSEERTASQSPTQPRQRRGCN
ncbi:unnamed protein product [Schistosoma margrebowiei]|uniref:Uncharacterized protein n=1 Tax=Schistosoma margrebowiei TaxID=48269 RepID=A0A183N4D2_9TREM|nr:unnamed protein product [Schistosoma margrebowiei]